MGIDTFVEIGPGKTLSGFVKKTNNDINKNINKDENNIKILNINNEETLQNTIREFRKEI